MKSASSGLDVIAEEDNDDENSGAHAQVVPSIVATEGGGNAEMEDESEVMSQVVPKNIDTVSRKGPLVVNPIEIELIIPVFFLMSHLGLPCGTYCNSS